jgi:DNA gyrase inhibitor GyrI
MYADESQLLFGPTITIVEDLPDAIEPEKLHYDYRVRVLTEVAEWETEKVKEHVFEMTT